MPMVARQGDDNAVSVRNQAGRPTSAELERRKANVMDVATQLFIAQGFAETSLVDIAKRAGVATRTVYQHFGDKEAIFREVLFARRASSLMPIPEVRAGESLYDTLRRAADVSCQYVYDAHSIDVMRLMIAESRRFPDLTTRVANATFARFRAGITALFAALATAARIPDGDHALSARLFLDLVLGTTPVMFYGAWQTMPAQGEDLDCKIDMFLRGRFGIDPADARIPAPANDPTPRRRRPSARGGRGDLARAKP